MRHVRLLLPVLIALTAAACARQEPPYYVTDAATGQRISTGQQASSEPGRGLFTGSTTQASAYASAPAQSQASRGRGLFGSDIFSSSSRAPVYAYQPQAPQTYAYQPPHQAPTPRQAPRQAARYGARTPAQPTVMQYRPPQPAPQAYAQQPYYAPRPQPAGYYAARYRWY